MYKIKLMDIFKGRAMDEYALCCGHLENALLEYVKARHRHRASASDRNKDVLREKSKEFWRLYSLLFVLKKELDVPDKIHLHYCRELYQLSLIVGKVQKYDA